MDKPKEYDIVNPLWQRGRAIGIAEERERIIELLHRQHDEKHRANPSGVCRACRILGDIVGDGA